MDQVKDKFAAWGILELMGHRRLAGYVQEAELAGHGLIRIDIPSDPPVTQFYGAGSVYCLTPTTEEIARAVAATNRPEPVHRWELPPAHKDIDDDPLDLDDTNDDDDQEPPL